MAKLKAPLLSLGASGQLAKTLVFFPWKGLNVAREYIIPSNPQTTPQNTQRGYVTDAVDDIHAKMAESSNPLDEDDKTAWQAMANLQATPRTWFNELVKQIVNQLKASLTGTILTDCTVVPADGSLGVTIYDIDSVVTAGDWYYGTSPTALLNTVAGAGFGGTITGTITPLTNGVKYYFQFRPSAPAGNIGDNSGIYHGTPSA